jgi:hypothetical protein
MVLLGVACAGDDEGTGSNSASGSASESGSESASASESMSMSESASESGSTSADESGSDTGSTSNADTTTGDGVTCSQAADVTACNAAGSGAQVCLWLSGSTWVGGNGGPCMSIDVGPTGVCAVDEQDDGCIGAEPSCPDGMTSVWYREVGLEVGAIEVISFGADQLCDSPGGGFMQCMYDPDTETYTPPECSCICPMGE